MHRGVFDDKKLGKQLRILLSYEIHVETISISTDISGHIHTETISTWNNIAIINHLSLNALDCFIIVAKACHCLYVSILWNDLESSRMCLWNKYRYLLLELVPMFTTPEICNRVTTLVDVRILSNHRLQSWLPLTN